MAAFTSFDASPLTTTFHGGLQDEPPVPFEFSDDDFRLRLDDLLAGALAAHVSDRHRDDEGINFLSGTSDLANDAVHDMLLCDEFSRAFD